MESVSLSLVIADTVPVKYPPCPSPIWIESFTSAGIGTPNTMTYLPALNASAVAERTRGHGHVIISGTSLSQVTSSGGQIGSGKKSAIRAPVILGNKNP